MQSCACDVCLIAAVSDFVAFRHRVQILLDTDTVTDLGIY